MADLVPQGARLADVGTDHAYLPVWLLLQGRIASAVASDVRPGPLDRARLTARQYDCTEGLTFRLCDGLDGIGRDQADAVVIAGMGGETIGAILSRADWLADPAVRLILQPMSQQHLLRRWLWQHGFALTQERIVREGDRLYVIVSARHGDAKELSLGEEWVGCQKRGMEQGLRGEYLRSVSDKLGRALAGMERGASGDTDRERQLRQARQAVQAMKEEWEGWQR